MSKINSVLARFSGTVTYDDNTTGMFHTQLENDLIWSIMQSESQENMRQISWYRAGGSGWPYWGIIITAIEKIPYVAYFEWDTNYPDHQKTITDMVARIEFTFALDDNTSDSVAIIIEGLHDDIRIEPASLVGETPSNIQEIQDKVLDMLYEIMDTVDIRLEGA